MLGEMEAAGGGEGIKFRSVARERKKRFGKRIGITYGKDGAAPAKSRHKGVAAAVGDHRHNAKAHALREGKGRGLGALGAVDVDVKKIHNAPYVGAKSEKTDSVGNSEVSCEIVKLVPLFSVSDDKKFDTRRSMNALCRRAQKGLMPLSLGKAGDHADNKAAWVNAKLVRESIAFFGREGRYGQTSVVDHVNAARIKTAGGQYSLDVVCGGDGMRAETSFKMKKQLAFCLGRRDFCLFCTMTRVDGDGHVAKLQGNK